jgi:hypothetical protein
MPAGRPRKYGPKILEIMEKYIDDCTQYGDLVPSVAGCAHECGVVRETFHQWDRDEDKPEFSHTLKRLLQVQERMCVKGGLGGDYNSTIVKLMLANHGYSDKIEQKTEHSGLNIEVKQYADD